MSILICLRKPLLVAALAMACVSAHAFTASELKSYYDKYQPAVCRLSFATNSTNPGTGEKSSRDGSALGLIVSPEGLVMTHGHFKREDVEPFNLRVFIGEGENEKEYGATVLTKPDDVNICFLQIDSEAPLNLPYVKFAKDTDLSLAQEFMVIGIYGDTLDFSRAFQVRRVGSVLTTPRTTYCIDESLRFGFVGGPVITRNGLAVGVVGFDLSEGEGGDLYIRSGHPLVYQASLFQKYIDTPPLPPDDTVEASGEDAWLGVFTQPLTDDLAEYWNLPQQGGVVVSTVVPGSPAAQAGLVPGDIITSFAGTPVTAKLDREIRTFTMLVRETGINNTATIQLLRNGEPTSLDVTLVSRPKTARDANEYEEPHFGLTVREITTDVRIMLNLSEDVKGVIVRSAKSGSPAHLARFRPGVIILRLGDHEINNLDDFKSAVEQVAEAKPKEVAVFCRVGPNTGFLRLEPRW